MTQLRASSETPVRTSGPEQGEITARALIPTRFGEFEMLVMRWVDEGTRRYGLSTETVVLVKGDVRGKSGVLTRLHSECLTSEVFGSVKCDCADQLATAQRQMADAGEGVLVYLRQEGRGIGLTNKIRAYALQNAGADTVDANRLLGLPDDLRTFEVAARALEVLEVRSISLITNNPLKVHGIEGLGVKVERRVPSLVPVGQHAASYLAAKRERMGHELPSELSAVNHSHQWDAE